MFVLARSCERLRLVGRRHTPVLSLIGRSDAVLRILEALYLSIRMHLSMLVADPLPGGDLRLLGLDGFFGSLRRFERLIRFLVVRLYTRVGGSLQVGIGIRIRGGFFGGQIALRLLHVGLLGGILGVPLFHVGGV